ncbi:MAG: DUF3148 domain-containing protein [Aphanocapsa feldmannii 277cV]|uniref:DUF3148 domain-containing protein n=2 Tax=Aphanocapsa feldmannii TaxID=192050 RepID=A0A524RL81_9CHRO|nr:MAG: DUF3148 domain-containing protein [Aphanocapsa feldmannii 288cV]TGG90829.1 MAG: DUF3148 domain-containing protein [Aphanocapsa feldmannii 277cV]TGH22944.1 MAG: DUF3148 domain-containing protein [Aphanocapsa feldmannii 277cI]
MSDALSKRADATAATPAVGDGVILCRPQPFLKSADPMPMLRPPDLAPAGEQGTVLERRANGLLAVRFPRGTFLVQQSDVVPGPPAEPC